MTDTLNDLTHESLQVSESRYRRIFETAPYGILLLNADTTRIEDVNPYLIEMLGYSRAEFLEKKLWEMGAFEDIAQSKEMLTELQTKDYVRYEDLPLKTKTGARIQVEFINNTYVCEGIKVIQCNILDITNHKRAEAEIHTLAFYDPLTGLPNRRLLHDRLQHAFATSARHHNHNALLFIDLDNFKTLNNIKGHNIGDLLLIEVAERLQACVREEDTVARLGGDEFVVILEDLGKEEAQAAAQAETVGKKIHDAINRPCALHKQEYKGSASIGVSLFCRNDDISVDELLRRAHSAMYQAKNAGRNTLRFYDPVMQAALEARAALESDLHRALAENQFRLYYQMQVDHSGHILGAEALIRWQHPQHGMVLPLQFIPLAEETGLIMPIGQWVLETACAQLKAWEADPLTRGLQLAVNISARQFRQPDFVEQVLQTLRRHAFNPDQLKLELELTESMVMDNIDDTIVKMQALRDVGVRFSMDDFGTGYSSLSYLTLLPLDQLKIDQSFIHNIGVKHSDAVIVQTIIGMANSLGMEVIAEGVETEEQRAFLEQHGCILCQGYLFGEPVPVEEFEVMLKSS